MADKYKTIVAEEVEYLDKKVTQFLIKRSAMIKPDPTRWNKTPISSECLHKACDQCHGTGKKKDGTFCVHMISCPCPKCRVSF